MKIAISGSAGIGKTTLSKSLADRLGVDHIGENYTPLFDQPKKLAQPIGEVARLFYQVLLHKRQLEQEYGAFITDRCPIDLFHLWVVTGLGKDITATSKFYNQCRSYAKEYDFVIIPPWGSIPLKQIKNPPDHKRRIQNPWVQLRNHATICGYTQMWLAPDKIIYFDSAVKDHADRMDLILCRLGLIAN